MLIERPQVLIIEDNVYDLRSYIRFLTVGNSDYDLHSAGTLKQALELLRQIEFAVVLTDLKLRSVDEGGFTIIKEVKAAYPATLVVIFRGIGGADSANEAI